MTGVPCEILLKEEAIIESLTEPINNIIEAVKRVLEMSPPELSADIAQRGIVLTGGGALLPGLDIVLSNGTGLPVVLAPEPLNSVVLGTGKVLENMDALRHVLFKQD